MKRFHTYKLDRCLLALLWLQFISVQFSANGQQEQQAPSNYDVKTRILIPNLPTNHYQFWFKNHPLAQREYQQICVLSNGAKTIQNLQEFRLLHSNVSLEDTRYLDDLPYGLGVLRKICSKIDEASKSCWGYENNCQIIHLMPECYGSSFGAAKSEQEQKIMWFSQADFGYILNRRKELNRYCYPDKHANYSIMSSFECTNQFRTCRGDNLFANFVNVTSSPEGKTFSLDKGKVGGWNCDLQSKRIQEEGANKDEVQNWFSEFGNYQKIESTNLRNLCDITIDKPAFIVKPAKTNDTYSNFADFINFYATVHMNNRFSEDNEVVVWNNGLPETPFDRMWSAFTRNSLRHIGQFEGKRVCFRKFISSLLSKKPGTMFYDTPLITGCSKTGLVDAFNKHVLHRLKIIQEYSPVELKHNQSDPIRVTIITRTTPRRVVNDQELAQSIASNSTDYKVRRVHPKRRDFIDILKIIQNTDILVGLHGSGLAYTLFLPDWAALVELNDCRDQRYKELARLRGVSYFHPTDKSTFLQKLQVDSPTGQSDKAKLAEPDKFMDYKIDESKFVELMRRASEKVRKNRSRHFKDLRPATPSKPQVGTTTKTDGKPRVGHDEL